MSVTEQRGQLGLNVRCVGSPLCVQAAGRACLCCRCFAKAEHIVVCSCAGSSSSVRPLLWLAASSKWMPSHPPTR